MGRRFLLGAALAGIGVLTPPSARADTKLGVDAWTQGDFAAAVRIWQDEAGRGDADALFNLGQAYKLGKGVSPDLAMAEQLFGRAAALGHIQASDIYGLLLFQRGERAQALPYLRASADRGDPRAQYLLGVAHFNGDMVSKDWIRAYALVSLAEREGLTQARTAREQMDDFIPAEQRAAAAVLAPELASEATATRERQLAAADLGALIPAPATSAVQSQPTPPVAARTIAAADPLDIARRVAGDDSAASAGADYARPVIAATPATPAPPPRPAATPPPRPVVAAAPAPVAPKPAAAPGPWRVQLGAFGVKANADAAWNRVRGRPELSGHARLDVQSGAVIKLQASGFETQQAAQAACARLQAAGIGCLAVKG